MKLTKTNRETYFRKPNYHTLIPVQEIKVIEKKKKKKLFQIRIIKLLDPSSKNSS